MNNRQNHRIHRPALGEILLLFLLIAQVSFLIVTTFSLGNHAIDGDTGRLYQHMEAIWESGTLFVPGWIYPTTMELDCSLLLALPFYGITKDAVIAFACSCVVIIFLWIGVASCLVGRINRYCSLHIPAPLVCTLILIPYSTANLYYWNMMFLNGAQYAFKVMIPLLLICLLLEPNPKAPSRGSIFLLALYLAGLYLTSLSSGIYVAALGIAPVLVAFFILWLYQKIFLTPYFLKCTAGSVITVLLGLSSAHLMKIQITGGQMRFNSFQTLAENTANCIVGFFRLFGAVTRETTSVLRLSGFAQLLCWILSLALLLCLTQTIHRIWHNKSPPPKKICELLLALPALWNFFFLVILNTSYGDPYFEVRYHLIGSIPLFFLLAVQFQKFHDAASERMQVVLRVAVPLFLMALLLLCDRRAYNVYWNTDGTVGINQKEQTLCSMIQPLDVTDVFVLQSNTTAEICNSLDKAHTYKLAWLQGDRCFLQTFDGHTSGIDAHPESNLSALVLTPDYDLAELPAYLQTATYYGETEDYTIYLLDNGSLLDGVVGLPYSGTGLDYPDSVGYVYQGTVDGNRTLNTDGYDGIVMQSPDLKFAHTTDIFLSYTCQTNAPDTMGIVVLSQNGTVLETQSLSASASQVVFHDVVPGDGYQLSVELYAGACASLQNIVFTSTGS